MDIDEGQGYDDLLAIMMDEPLLETGFGGDGDGGVIRDRLGHQLSKWPNKIPESLIPPYSCRQPNTQPLSRQTHLPHRISCKEFACTFHRPFRLLIFLMAFVGLPQRFGDMVKASYRSSLRWLSLRIDKRCAGEYATSAISGRASVKECIASSIFQ